MPGLGPKRISEPGLFVFLKLGGLDQETQSLKVRQALGFGGVRVGGWGSGRSLRALDLQDEFLAQDSAL